jgi:hypothetical protein
MSKFHLYCSCTHCHLTLTTQNLESHFETHSRPQHACGNPECNKVTTTKFCSRICSAIVSNAERSVDSRAKQRETLAVTLLGKGIVITTKEKNVKPKKIKRSTTIKQRVCSCCGKIDEIIGRGRFQSDKCTFCSNSLAYRRSCEFKFNLKDYPNEFDFRLLTEHGMFNPRTNPKGVSRDHMLSVHYGKENRIPPSIISHPANCRLMLQGDNTKKQSESSITYDDLLVRIAEWDAKYLVAAPENRILLYTGL